MNRPWYLTVYLVIIMLGAVASLFSYTMGSNMVMQSMPNLPEWSTWLLAGLSVLQLVSAVMIWKWQKNGIYLFYATGVVATLFNLVYLGVTTALIGLISFVLMYLATKSTWQNFK